MATLTIDQKVTVRLKVADRAGNIKTIQGVPNWSLSDGSLASLAVSVDGLSATVTPGDRTGTVTLSVEVQAESADGFHPVTVNETIDVRPGEATFVTLEVDAPVAK